MKKLLTAIAFGVFTTTGVGALAQTTSPGYGPGFQQDAAPAYQQGSEYRRGPGMGGRRGDPAQRIQRRLDRMSEYLGLDETQKGQIRTIMEEQHARRMSMRAETHNRISAVLNEDQRAKLEQMRAQRPKGRPDGGWGRRGGGRAYGPGSGFVPGS
jgi:Spy/CpxP family protein refolding chaperone